MLAFALMQVLAVTVLGIFLFHQAARAEMSAQTSIANNLMALAEPHVISLLEKRDTQGIKQYLNSLIKNTAIAGVYVTNPPGTLTHELGQNDAPPNFLTQFILSDQDSNLVVESQLFQDNISKGLLKFTLSSAPINASLSNVLINNAILLLAMLLLSLSVTYKIISSFTTPLQRLVDIAANIGRGDWQQHISTPKTGYQEIGDLGNALSESTRLMAEQINNLEHTQDKLLTSEQQLRSLVNNMREALFELDKDGQISFLNPAWQLLTGYNTTDSFGKKFSDFLPNQSDREMFSQDNLGNLDLNNCELHIRSAGSKPIRVELDAHSTFDHHSQLIGVVGRFQDISERFELAQTLEQHRRQLYRISITDELTNLYNRRHFEKIMAQKLPQLLQHNQSLCLALIDIDGFKFINDTYGHPVGDQVLKTLATLLHSMKRDDDTVARLAGDEFAVLFADTDAETARGLCEKIIDSISNTRVRLTVGHLQLRASIGMSISPFHGTTVQDLTGAADVALYQAKRRKRGHLEVLSTDISQGIMEVFSRGFELRNALTEGDIVPTFQPINDLRSGQPIAYEVLSVMRRGETLITASQFIKVAEDLGLVREIDLSVINQALQIAPPDVELFLNISLNSFNDENFATELLQLVKPACALGRPITIEITERETISLTDSLLADIKALRDAGCKLALDDFGQGYSTYNYLRVFRPEYLKIDGSFVEKILNSREDRIIIESVHELAKSFGAISIAESIEDETILEAVVDMGVHCGQGYFYARPDVAEKVFASSVDVA